VVVDADVAVVAVAVADNRCAVNDNDHRWR
jgi:hypothetical protein